MAGMKMWGMNRKTQVEFRSLTLTQPFCVIKLICMRCLGIDFGTKQIGLAISDEMGIIAGTYGTLKRKGLRNDVEKLREIIERERIQKIIIGYPMNMDGSAGKTVKQVDDFVAAMRQVMELPIVTWDERLSSVSAEKLLIQGDVRRHKRKKVIDQLAAVIILQNYLDYQNLSIQ
jgi:putative Holliday junction resolvase